MVADTKQNEPVVGGSIDDSYYCRKCEEVVDTLPLTHVEREHDGDHLGVMVLTLAVDDSGNLLALDPDNHCAAGTHTWDGDTCTACEAVMLERGWQHE
jgi:hypothetical protein